MVAEGSNEGVASAGGIECDGGSRKQCPRSGAENPQHALTFEDYNDVVDVVLAYSGGRPPILFRGASRHLGKHR